MLKLWSPLAGRSPAAIIERSGLFDASFYLDHNRLRDLERSRAFDHYSAEGAASGLRPHPLFDPAWYGTQTSSAAGRRDPLLHYLRVGSQRGLRPNPFFDPAFYACANPDVALDGFEPFTHYAARGWRERRETNGDPRDGATSGQRAGLPVEPTEAEWRQLPDRRNGVDPCIDIVMPVYGGRAETFRALHRVLSSSNRRAFELVVIDDASPDRDISARLGLLAESGQIRLIVNETNRGFVASVNRGTGLHPTRDVILLNADTEVFGDWVDRLSDAAHRSEDTGTVTPWSSDATILSYPIRLRPNLAPLEVSDEALDRVAASTAAQDVEIPTAVGFCMFIKRACLDDVGPFDERRFGRGYGEENDFCRRAAYRGWRSIAASTVFVRHHGGRSFGPDKSERLQAGLATIAALHPGYLRLISRFNRTDPLRLSRQLLDEARIRAADPAHVLTGAVAEAAEPERHANTGIVMLTPSAGPTFGCFDLWSNRVPITPNLPPLDPARSDDALASRVEALGIKAVRMTGIDARSTSLLERIARVCGLPVDRSA